MKKFVLILACALLLCAFVFSVSAAQSATATVSASPNPVHPGDTFTITVSVTEVNDCNSAGFLFDFNKEVFEYVSGKPGSSLGGFFAGVDVRAGNLAGYAMNSTAKVQGELFQITLKVKESAAFGTYTFGGTLSMSAVDGAVACTTQSLQLAVVCNHSFGGWTADASGTTHTHVCSVCNAPETVTHTWNEGEVTTASTCAAEGVKTFTCTACGAQKTEPVAKIKHKYDNSCDTTCNACGAERKTSHKYPDKCTSDETGHWYQCTVCKHKKDVAAHKPGAEPTEQTAQTCTVCGFIIKPALGHTHDYQLEWSADETGHWHACSGCDNQHELAEHEYDDACDKDCNVCGQERETEHIYYENYLSDESGHWHECRICGYQLEKEVHMPSASGMCSKCGYKTQAADHTHSYTDTWTWDVTGHWQTCECGHSSDTAPHSWDDGRVAKKPTDTEDGARTYKCTVCGAEMSEIIPMGTVITDSFPWVVLLIVGGALIVGVVIFVIVGVAKGKKKSGKFGAHDELQEMTEV